MIEKYDLVNLIQNYEYYLDRLSSLVYGSLDIRERDNKKYIYVHFRKDGKIITKYVGEYTENLYNEILSNNVEIKEINKKIRYIEKYIKEKDYKKKEVSEETKDNIRKVSNNKEKLLLDLAKLENINISVENIYNILSNTEVNNILSDEVVKFYNLLNGFEYLLNEEYYKFEFNTGLLCSINKRMNHNSIFLNDYALETINKDIKSIMDRDIPISSKAIELLLYILRRNIFKVNNLSTAFIFSNMYLLYNSNGVLTVPFEFIDRFKSMIATFSNGKDTRILKKFIITKCYIKNIDDIHNEKIEADNYNIKTTKIYNYFRENDQ